MLGFFFVMEIKDLYKLFLEHPAVSTDSRRITPGCMYFALKGEKFDGNRFAADSIKAGAAYAVADDPSLTGHERIILVDDVLETLQALATHHRRKLGVPMISITGSNGKTTTKELTRDVLNKKYKVLATAGNLNNHIGVPLTLLSLTGDTEMAVVEMGANHQGEINMLCNIADPDYVMITNIGKAHLEGFGGVEGIKKGKSEMYRYAAYHHKKIFINTDDEVLVSLIPDGADILKYSASGLLEVIKSDPTLTLKIEGKTVVTNLFGAYNLPNIAFAFAAGRYFGVALNDICDALQNYQPDNNRSQIKQEGNTTYIMDAYNANPTSMRLSLESFSKNADRKKLAVLGDMLELGEETHHEHRAMIGYARELGLAQVIFIGNHFAEAAMPDYGLYFRSAAEAKPYFANLDKSDMVILLKGSRGTAVEKILDNG